jgi:hypothetical protein
MVRTGGVPALGGDLESMIVAVVVIVVIAAVAFWKMSG